MSNKKMKRTKTLFSRKEQSHLLAVIAVTAIRTGNGTDAESRNSVPFSVFPSVAGHPEVEQEGYFDR